MLTEQLVTLKERTTAAVDKVYLSGVRLFSKFISHRVTAAETETIYEFTLNSIPFFHKRRQMVKLEAQLRKTLKTESKQQRTLLLYLRYFLHCLLFQDSRSKVKTSICLLLSKFLVTIETTQQDKRS